METTKAVISARLKVKSRDMVRRFNSRGVSIDVIAHEPFRQVGCRFYQQDNIGNDSVGLLFLGNLKRG